MDMTSRASGWLPRAPSCQYHANISVPLERPCLLHHDPVALHGRRNLPRRSVRGQKDLQASLPAGKSNGSPGNPGQVDDLLRELLEGALHVVGQATRSSTGPLTPIDAHSETLQNEIDGVGDGVRVASREEQSNRLPVIAAAGIADHE